MGYCMEVECDAFIPKENIPAALDAARRLMGLVQEQGGGGAWGPEGKAEKWYSWVGTENCLRALEANDLAAFLREWRYETEPTLDDGLALTWFIGEKLGDDALLWSALGPFVAAGSTLTCRGEDGAVWRWAFDGSRMVEQDGKVTFS